MIVTSVHVSFCLYLILMCDVLLGDDSTYLPYMPIPTTYD